MNVNLETVLRTPSAPGERQGAQARQGHWYAELERAMFAQGQKKAGPEHAGASRGDAGGHGVQGQELPMPGQAAAPAVDAEPGVQHERARDAAPAHARASAGAAAQSGAAAARHANETTQADDNGSAPLSAGTAPIALLNGAPSGQAAMTAPQALDAGAAIAATTTASNATAAAPVATMASAPAMPAAAAPVASANPAPAAAPAPTAGAAPGGGAVQATPDMQAASPAPLASVNVAPVAPQAAMASLATVRLAGGASQDAAPNQNNSVRPLANLSALRAPGANAGTAELPNEALSLAAEEEEASAPAPAPTEHGDDYAQKLLHVYRGADGVHAWIRDADLKQHQASAVVDAMARELANSGQRLATLTVNGKRLFTPYGEWDNDDQHDGYAATASADASTPLRPTHFKGDL